MLIVVCPTCKTNLVEEGKNGKIDCLKCGDEFDFVNSEFCNMSYIEIYESLIELHPDKAVKIAKDLGLRFDIPTTREKSKNKFEKAFETSVKNLEKENEVAAENQIAAKCGREAYLQIIRKIKGQD